MADVDPILQMMTDAQAQKVASVDPNQAPSTQDPTQPAPVSPSAPQGDPIAAMMAQAQSDKVAAANQAAAQTNSGPQGDVNDLGYYKDSAVRGVGGFYNGVTGIGHTLDKYNPVNWAIDGVQNLISPGSADAVTAARDKLYQQGQQGVANALAPAIGNYQPSNEASRIVGQGIEGAVSAAPYALMPEAGLPALAGGFVGGAAGEGAAAAGGSLGLSDNTQGWLRAGGNIAGSLGTSLGVAKLLPSALPTAGAQSLRDAGITSLTPQLAADNAAGPVSRLAANYADIVAPKIPLSGAANANGNAANAVMSQYNTALDNAGQGVLSSVGGPASKFTTGQQLQSSLDSNLDTLKANASANYTTVDNLVPKNTTVPAASTLDQLGLQISSTGKIVASPQSAVDATTTAPAITAVRNAFLADGTPNLSYASLKGLRTDIGSKLTSSITNSGADQGALKQLYGAITDDMTTAVQKAGGQDALDAWNNANTQYSNYTNNLTNKVQKLAEAGPGGVTPEGVSDYYTNSLTKGPSVVQNALDSGQLTHSDLPIIAQRQITSFGTDPTTGTWSLQNFLKNYNIQNNLNPEATNLTFGSLPSGTQDLLGKAADLAARGTAELAPTATAAQKFTAAKAANALSGTIMGHIMGAGEIYGADVLAQGGSLVPTIAGIAKAAPVVAASSALNRLATSQWFLRALTKQVPDSTKAASYLSSFAKMYPSQAGDINAVAGSIQNSQQNSQQ